MKKEKVTKKKVKLMDFAVYHPNSPYESQKTQEQQFADIDKFEHKAKSAENRRRAKQEQYDKRVAKRRRHEKAAKILTKKIKKEVKIL